MAIPWNVKTNQSCWNCFHFQRYDPATGILKPQYGECRKKAPKGFRVEDQGFSEKFPFITSGPLDWCGDWKKTTLVVPELDPDPDVPVWPDVFTNWVAWNVKTPIEISCWNCNHFQAGKPDPRDPDDADGECRKHSPPPVTLLDTVEHADWLNTTHYEFNGLLYWCGEWELATHDIPPFTG